MGGGRAARAGLFTYAGLLVVDVLLGFLQTYLIDAGGTENHQLRNALIEAASYGFFAIQAGVVVALYFVSRAPRVRGLCLAATGLAVVALVAEIAQFMLVRASSFDVVGGIFRATSASIVLTDAASDVLLLVAIARIAREIAPRPWSIAALIVAVVRAARAALYLVGFLSKSPSLHGAARASYYVTAAAIVVLCAYVGARAAKLTEPDARVAPRDAGSLSPEWGAASGGIGLYLGAAAARVLFALMGYAVMMGASGAHELSDLRSTRDSVLFVAIFSGAASIAMLVGVFRITRAPPESGGAGAAMAALVFMAIGFVLDLWTTSITRDALGGSVSAAFFAMDALPIIGCVATVLGVFAGVALLRSFGAMATALAETDLAERARGATALVAIAGGVAGLAQLLLTKAGVAMLGLLVVILLPLAIAALVQFLRVAIPLSRAIRARLSTASSETPARSA